MRLLVSVADEDEARAALEGGADIVDAKDPHHGALGAVSIESFGRIHAIASRTCPVSAAIGDATDETTIERAARAFADAGAAFVKVGFAGIRDASRVRSLIGATVQGAGGKGVVAVAYADRATALTLDDLLTVASIAGARGVLIDTADKNGLALPRLIAGAALSAWVARAHDTGLFVAVAGKLTLDDLPWARECGADIAGVRGAACEGGRASRLVAEKVRELCAYTDALNEPAMSTSRSARA